MLLIRLFLEFLICLIFCEFLFVVLVVCELRCNIFFLFILGLYLSIKDILIKFGFRIRKGNVLEKWLC